jgi:rhodanese-related sulfurtransferase
MRERLQALMHHAESRKSQSSPYAGDISVREAWEFLSQEPALVIDVRTAPEWSFSGVPDTHETHGTLACISWVRYPDFDANPAFAETLEHYAKDKNIPLFFLCKTGGRSHQAANKAAMLGYSYSFNLTHGFEGDANSAGQRGKVNGWKAEGLPWTQA